MITLSEKVGAAEECDRRGRSNEHTTTHTPRYSDKDETLGTSMNLA
jgi:hypothetical protein